ncbi:MAG: DUF58 domain-containing protein [Parvularculaceae bacterium]|nr:DUF58 domain-containing protein [Parvularculaceae bacterium]
MSEAASARSAIRREAEEVAGTFPALLIEAERVAQTVASGMHGRRRPGQGENFWQHRAYVFGDPVNAIDWRQSARASGRLYVRQNEWDAAAAVWIWRDASASLDYRFDAHAPTKRRRADVLAVALSILLAEAGERIGLLGGARAHYGRTAPMRILEGLLAAPVEDGGPPPGATGFGSRVAMLSDFFIDLSSLQAAVGACAGAGAAGVLLQVVDAAEEEFPFEGRIEFEDVETRSRLVLGEAASLGDDYRRLFIAHREAVADIARRYGWTFIAHRTDRPPQTALLSLYRALADLKALK